MLIFHFIYVQNWLTRKIVWIECTPNRWFCELCFGWLTIYIHLHTSCNNFKIHSFVFVHRHAMSIVLRNVGVQILHHSFLHRASYFGGKHRIFMNHCRYYECCGQHRCIVSNDRLSSFHRADIRVWIIFDIADCMSLSCSVWRTWTENYENRKIIHKSIFAFKTV